MSETAEIKTLGDVLADIWQAKFWVCGAGFLGFVFATLFVVSATPHYKSHMIVSPANPMNGAESSSLLADENLFALRFLMQRVGSGNSSDFLRFENTYDGARVAEVLLTDARIREGLKLDQRFEFSKAKNQLSAAELSDYIAKRVRLENVGTTSLRRLVYTHPRADFGRYFLTALHTTTDGLIRKTIRGEATQRVAHLRNSIRGNNNPDHRRALTSLLMEQERLLMLASVDTPYAAAVVEPSSSSAKAVWPSKALVYSAFLAVCSLLGFVAHGVFAAGASEEVRRRPISARKWFKSDSGNVNRPLTGEKLAENKRDVA